MEINLWQVVQFIRKQNKLKKRGMNMNQITLVNETAARNFVEQAGQRVLTTAQLAESYGTDKQIIINNFNRNKERYKEGKHFVALEGREKNNFINQHQIDLGSKNAKTLYLWTEKGAWLHAKSLNTDKAWDAYEMLVDEYYRMSKEIKVDSYMIEDPVERAKRWIIEQQEKQLLIAENSVKDQLIGELKPKADYTDKILQSTGLMTITQIAKDYGMSAQKMNAILHELKVQYSQNRQWLLYSKYHAEGYTHSETIPITHSDGTPGTKLNTKWTQKGRLFLYQLLKKNGILPTIEKRNEV